MFCRAGITLFRDVTANYYVGVADWPLLFIMCIPEKKTRVLKINKKDMPMPNDNHVKSTIVAEI